MSGSISPDWIEWDADEHAFLTASDLEWKLVQNFPIKNIGGQDFIDEMKDYLDEEIASMHEDEGCRVSTWISMDKDLQAGGNIKEPVQIALVDYVDANYTRKSICGGWHRLGAAIKYGHESIPAYVGVVKP